MRDSRYDILFEPVKIGPVTARNRFYQVPHCCGMGYRYPASMAAMRGIKAEGGWGVVCTEEVEIHHTSEIAASLEGRLWDDKDIPALAAMCDAVHAHGSLAGIEFVYNGHHAANRYSREPVLAPSHTITDTGDPVHARAMDKTDIANLRRWHRQAALRARRAGFDIIYVYAGHDMTVLQHFISRRHNQRTDEYGGSLENRIRLFREVIEDTKEAVGDTCGVAVRLAVDELLGPDGTEAQGEGHDIVAMLAELPDLWDVNISGWENDSQTARFAEEGYQEPYISFVKKLTTKPVVGVGRYTSPDAMVRVVKQGIMDMIGAARPSIADPFLPRKIEEGRLDDIRECIGCNICITGDWTMTPIRCTQNPTMGEEWRKDWHPEIIPSASADLPVLIVGGGPAGLEAARALGARGVSVTLAEAGEEWGGRVSRESRLPGLATWARVRDWRMGQLHKLPNVSMYLASRLTAQDVLSYGIPTVAIATGCRWVADARGRHHHHPVSGLADGMLMTPDDIMDGVRPGDGPVVVYDDEAYFMGGACAELLRSEGFDVTYMTPDPVVSSWTKLTMEQERIQARLIEIGVRILTARKVVERNGNKLIHACIYSGRLDGIACNTLIPVTSRAPVEDLWLELDARRSEWAVAGLTAVTRIGDCNGPSTIAAAVYSGHRFARDHGTVVDPDKVPFRREEISIK